MKILFFCTGNTCRSPLAMALGRKIRPDIEFDSCGLAANDGDSVSQNSVIAAEKYGVALDGYCSKSITPELAADADYIIPVSRRHAQVLCSLGVPQQKILMLTEEVSDPFGCDITVYEACAEQLFRLLSDALKEL